MVEHFQRAVLVLDGLQSHRDGRVVRRRATTARPPPPLDASTGSYVAPATVVWSRLGRVRRAGSRDRRRCCCRSRDVTHAQHVHEHSTAAAVDTTTSTAAAAMTIDCLLWNDTVYCSCVAITTPTSATTDCRATIASRSPVCAVVNYCLQNIGGGSTKIFLTFRPRRQARQHCRGVSVGWPARYGSLDCLSIISSFINDCQRWRWWRVLCVRTHSGKPRTSGVRRSQFAAVPLSPGRSDSRISRRGIAATGQWARRAR